MELLSGLFAGILNFLAASAVAGVSLFGANTTLSTAEPAPIVESQAVAEITLPQDTGSYELVALVATSSVANTLFDSTSAAWSEAEFLKSLNARFAGLLSHTRWLINDSERVEVVSDNKSTSRSFIDKQIERTTDSIGDSIDTVSEELEANLSMLDTRMVSAEATLANLSIAAASSSIMAANLNLNGHWLSGDGDDEGVFVDVSGRVGVGTSTFPAALGLPTLSVNGSGAFYNNTNNAVTALYIASGPSAGAGFPLIGLLDQRSGGFQWNIENSRNGDGSLGFYRSGIGSRMVLSAAGNLGIGTTTPGSKLTVVGDAYVTGTTTLLGSLITNSQSDTLTFLGVGAGAANTVTGIGEEGLRNTAVGKKSLFSNTTGTQNTAGGTESLYLNTTGNYNTANGVYSLYYNTTGSYNSAYGVNSLISNTSGSANTAYGVSSLRDNKTGIYNTAVGANALYSNVAGSYNTVVGYNSGFDTNTATSTGANTFIGYNTGRGIITGVNNTILGANVTGLLSTLSNNIIIADGAGNQRINVDANGNVGIGTTTPMYKLTVDGSSYLSGALNVGDAVLTRSNLGLSYASASDISNNINIAAWGDSLTASSYPTKLASLSGYTVYNGGVGGETSTQIRARMLAATDKHTWPTIIWAGRNNYSNPTQVKADIADMVAALTSAGNSNYIILSVLNSENVNEYLGQPGYSTIIQLNNDLASTYGSHYIDIRSYIVSQYDSGIPQDVIDNGNDIPPSSLRADTIHFNDAGNQLVAEYVFQNISLLQGSTRTVLRPTDIPSIFNYPAIRYPVIRGTSTVSSFLGTSTFSMMIRDNGSSDYAGIDFGIDSVNTKPLARVAMQKTSLGSLLQFGTSNNYSSGITSSVTIDQNGRLGLGTSTPAEMLAVQGNIQFSGSGLRQLKASNGAALLSYSTDAIVRFNNMDNEEMFRYGNGGGFQPLIIQNSYVGIGTTTPIARLTVVGTTTVPNGGTTAIMDLSNSSNVSALRVLANGNVGIGTTTPNNLLQVYDLVEFDNADFVTNLGYQAGKNLAGGAVNNTFIGYQAGHSSSTGSTNAADYNTGVGYSALLSNTSGDSNVAVGHESLYSNTTGSGNSALGTSVLTYNTSGVNNTASGYRSLFFSTTGSNNTASGYRSLYSNTTGNNNTAIGWSALYSSTVGSENTVVGLGALYSNTEGNQNIAFGYQAGRYLINGSSAASTTDYSIFLGTDTKALTADDQNTIVIGYNTNGLGSNTVVLGNDSIVTTALKGNVGIGTTTPNNLLQVYDLVEFDNADFGTNIGYQAGKNLVSGAQYNTFIGYQAGYSSSTGSTNAADNNTAIGYQSLFFNTAGNVNTANGVNSLHSNTSGSANTAFGVSSLYSNTTGFGNTANGRDAFRSNVDGDNNTALGYQAGRYLTNGISAASTTDNSLFLGYNTKALTADDQNTIVIGYNANGIGSNSVVLGNDSIVTTVLKGNVGIGTTTPSEKLTVVGTIQSTALLGGSTNLTTDASGNIIRDPSDARLKENVTTIENALETVLGLRGVRYEWIDKERFGDQFEIGFIAQEVDELVPEVVQKGGEYWSLNSKNLVAVVVEAVKEIWAKVLGHEERLNEYQGLIEELKNENTELKSRLESVERELDIEVVTDTNAPPVEEVVAGDTSPIPSEVTEDLIPEGGTEDPVVEEVVSDESQESESVPTEPEVVEETVTEPEPEVVAAASVSDVVVGGE